jgi:hypothetical protein
MAKEWATKDRYNPSHDVPKPRKPLPKVKVVVRSVPAWGDASSRSRGAVLERAVRPAWRGGQTGPAQRGAVTNQKFRSEKIAKILKLFVWN